jgi:glycosyltransferase involved in cell wall biosynthesis
MQVVILGPGVGVINRGYERLAVDLAAQLEKFGISAKCWSISNSPGVECVPSPSRDELEVMALQRMHQDPALRSISGWELHDWTLHTEDQLFSIAVAARLKQLPPQQGPLVVYLKWQGGLLDASGAATSLYYHLADGQRAGTIRTIIHTDWAYPPIINKLAEAGFVFHAVGPWISHELRDLGIPPTKVFVQPMGTMSAPLHNVKSSRAELRDSLGIPQSAFVVLSVGAFHKEGKNLPYLAEEFAAFKNDPDFYWAVAGTRGEEPATWEARAKENLGNRFKPLVNVPFDQMPGVYGMADLAVSSAWNETFGLCYVEPQLCGVPLVAHDCGVSRWVTAGLPDELVPFSRLDMRTPGNGLFAVQEWRKRLSDPQQAIRVNGMLEAFRRTQESRYAWEKLGPVFSDIFRHVAETGFTPNLVQKIVKPAHTPPMNVLARQQQPGDRKIVR